MAEPIELESVRGMLIDAQAQLKAAQGLNAADAVTIATLSAQAAELTAANETNLAAAKADRDALEASKNAEIDGLNARIRDLDAELNPPDRNEATFIPQDEAHVS